MAAHRPKLTRNQRRFVEEYLIDRLAVQAYLRAFGKVKANGKPRSYSGAHVQAVRLLQNPTIKAEIAAAERDYARRCRIRADKVLNEAAGIAFADIADLFDLSSDTPKLKSIRHMPARTRRAIASVKVKKTPRWEIEDGQKVKQPDEEVVEIKFCDKLAALDKLMKHLGLAKEITPLDALLAALGPQLGEQVRRALAGDLPGDGDPQADSADGSHV